MPPPLAHATNERGTHGRPRSYSDERPAKVKEAVMATMAASRKDYCAEVTMMEAHRGGKRNEKEKCFFWVRLFFFVRADVMGDDFNSPTENAN